MPVPNPVPTPKSVVPVALDEESSVPGAAGYAG